MRKKLICTLTGAILSLSLAISGVVAVPAGYAYAAENTAAADAKDSDSLTVYIAPTGTKYHYADCRTLENSTETTALTVAQAGARGYAPCGVCNPPAPSAGVANVKPVYSPDTGTSDHSGSTDSSKASDSSGSSETSSGQSGTETAAADSSQTNPAGNDTQEDGALLPAANLKWDENHIGYVTFDDPNTTDHNIYISVSGTGSSVSSGNLYPYDSVRTSYYIGNNMFSSGTYTFTVQFQKVGDDSGNSEIVTGPSYEYTRAPRLQVPYDLHWSDDGTFSCSPVAHALRYHFWLRIVKDGNTDYWNTITSEPSYNFSGQMTDPDAVYSASMSIDSDDLGVASNSSMSVHIPYKKGDNNVNTFTDVLPSAYYFNAVSWAKEAGITSGKSEDNFGANDNCNRAQMAQFLYALAGKPAVSGSLAFTDVPEKAYYRDAVIWAVQNHITSGTSETTFGPGEICTRAQMVQFLYVLAGKPAVSGSLSFTDVPEKAFYRDAVIWAVQNHITSGTSETTFGPGQNCTRGQMVQFLYLFNELGE